MRLMSRLVCLAVAVAVPALAASAHSHRHKSLQIVHPWTAATPSVAAPRARADAAVYMKIKSRSGQPDRLLSATTAVADTVEIVAGKGSSGAREPADTAIVIPTGQVDLTPTGPHVRLVGVKKRLDAYDTFLLTLIFERAGKVIVEVLVED